MMAQNDRLDFGFLFNPKNIKLATYPGVGNRMSARAATSALRATPQPRLLDHNFAMALHVETNTDSE